MITLPARPSLEQLKKQAKELLEAHRSHQPDALNLFAEVHPLKAGEGRPFALHDAQLVLARQYGFASWSKLKEEVEQLTSDFSARVRRFVLDSADGDYERAKRALTREPDFAHADFWSALVLGDPSGIRRMVEREPDCVNRPGGPLPQWTPLLYVSFSRFQSESNEAKQRFSACAEFLLESGADANDHFEHPSWPGSPLKPLYGATGVNNNPCLARLLIAHGAELNDGESIYHAAQLDHCESMEVLLKAGVSLGRHPHWKNTPVYFLLGSLLASVNWPATKRGIRWLLDHGCDPNIPCGDDDETALHAAIRGNHELEVVHWLLQARANPHLADKNGTLPMTLAHRAGRLDIIASLREFGAREVSLTPQEEFFEAAFSARPDDAARILGETQGLLASFDEEDRLALHRAAERGQSDAVRILLNCGFDISFKGTRDWGSTPLHTACWHGQSDVVDLLLERGAPFDIPANPPETSLAFGWAAHGSSHCRNPQGDYARIVRALLAAGATPHIEYADMASVEVADIIHAALAGRES